jgi:hypothetical protein
LALDERKRRLNEDKFDSWEELDDGGRRYTLEVPGRSSWKAIYLKEVDAEEATTKFWQEIHDETGELVEVHEKYPEDKGHQKP